jgi:hypothetical protein
VMCLDRLRMDSSPETVDEQPDAAANIRAGSSAHGLRGNRCA